MQPPHLPLDVNDTPMDSFPSFGQSGSAATGNPENNGIQSTNSPRFDIFDWYPKYQSCQRYFLDHAQHSVPVQALAAFVNIHLPFQKPANAIYNSSCLNTPGPNGPSPSRPSSYRVGSTPSSPQLPAACVSLLPYIRRLVATGMDNPGVLHGFFGDDWTAGIGPLHEQERRNYLFSAKSGGWASVKRDYDMLPLETVPFLRPLQAAADTEIQAAERTWSEWLAMEDWMVGPRAPDSLDNNLSPRSRPRE